MDYSTLKTIFHFKVGGVLNIFGLFSATVFSDSRPYDTNADGFKACGYDTLTKTNLCVPGETPTLASLNLIEGLGYKISPIYVQKVSAC